MGASIGELYLFFHFLHKSQVTLYTGVHLKWMLISEPKGQVLLTMCVQYSLFIYKHYDVGAIAVLKHL